ncbi:MAG: inosose dehydratase [Chloroflexota bacterium]|nr:inosose dehydratase [Chloroflexota bacterium]MEA2653390.1 inosose dehydratase [Chloroflexota bacterium]
MPSPALRVANAPVSFGVDEIMVDDAWMPAAVEILDWMVDIGFEGTELGPPGYLGDGRQLKERLSSRGLELVGAFLPQHFSRAERVETDQAWLRETLRLIAEGSPSGSRPFAVLSDHFDEPDRRAFSGRIQEHPETWLSPARFATLIDNLHRAAEICRAEGFEPVLHPHAGTYVETADEIARVMERIDPSLLGLCLDTGHFRFGGADPTQAVHDYHELIRHVHIKDCRTSVMDEVKAEGKGLEEALRRGVFCQLGLGDSGIDGVIDALRAHDYSGWLVVEQDQFLGPTDTPASVAAGQRANRDYLRRLGI